MAENIMIEIVTPEKVLLNEEVQIVMVPGKEGEFGVLKGHTPFLSSLKTGILRYIDKNSSERYLFISDGFAEALPDKVTILTESAERRKNIDFQRAKKSYERAQGRINKTQEQKVDLDYQRALASLQRAIYRMKIYEIKK